MTESSTSPARAAFSYPGHGPNARTGVAICHGFTGSPRSVLPWARYLADRGFAVSVPLLPGHGTHWRDLARHGWQDWYTAFETAYLDLAARTDDCYVAGLSMGGTIALRTAARHTVPGVVTVNPGFSFYDRRVRMVGLLKYFQRTTLPIKEENSTAPVADDGDYTLTPLAAVHQLRRLFSTTLRELPSVRTPVLVFKSDNDDVVPPSSLVLLRRRLGSRDLRVVRLPRSGHVATQDADAPLIFEESERFFLQYARSTTPPAAPSETP